MPKLDNFAKVGYFCQSWITRLHAEVAELGAFEAGYVTAQRGECMQRLCAPAVERHRSAFRWHSSPISDGQCGLRGVVWKQCLGRLGAGLGARPRISALVNSKTSVPSTRG